MVMRFRLRWILNFHSYSIRGQLILLLAVAVVPLIIVTTVVYRASVNVVMESLTRNRVVLMSEASQRVQQLLTGIESAAVQVNFHPDVQRVLAKGYVAGSYEDYKQHLDAFKAVEGIVISSRNILSAYVVSNEVRVRYIASSAVGFLNQDEAGMFPWFAGIDRTRTVSSWVATRRNEDDNSMKEWVATLVTPLCNLGTNRVIGHVLITINETALGALLSDKVLGDGERVLLSDAGGQLFYDSRGLYGTDVQGEEFFRRLSGRGERGTFLTGTGKGKLFITYVHLPRAALYLVSTVPLPNVLSQITSLNRKVLAVVFVCALLAMGLIFLLYGNITRPLTELVARMGHIGGGDFSVRPPTMGTRNEIRRIHEDVDGMARRIEALMAGNASIIEQKRTAELAALQSQISPHFLYNTLASIKCLALINSEEEIARMIGHLSEFYRHVLSGGRDTVTVEEEIQHVRSYTEIVKFRRNMPVEMEYNLDRRLLSHKTPKLVLQPFVENALVHGYGASATGGTVWIQLSRNGDSLVFEVIDRGKGMTKEELDAVLCGKAGGYAIRNVNERIRLRYGNGWGVRIESSPDRGTTATIRIPAYDAEDRT